MSSRNSGDIWAVSPRPSDHSRFAWDRAIFDTARRGYTDVVEGKIRSPHHLVMVTLSGGARRHQFKTDCGHRYDGPDRAGCASFLPAGCERRLRLEGVAWEWASIALRPDLLPGDDDGRPLLCDVPTFSNVQDPFLFGLFVELKRIHSQNGRLDLTYCDTMVAALVQYLSRRYGGAKDEANPGKLPAWRLRRITDYVEAHLDEEIRISTLASLVGLSEGHLHRAFKLTCGQTLLQFINERRIHRAMELLARSSMPITTLAHEVGFSSPSYFARVFRAHTGVGPAEYRRSLRDGQAHRT